MVASISTIFNGTSSLLLPFWTTTSCINAFETPIGCDPTYVQWLTTDDDRVGWSTTMLEALCTSQCKSDLEMLQDKVSSGCGNSSFKYGFGGNTSYTDIVDIRRFKYDIACMTDDNNGDFCLDVENSWNISALVSSGQVQWPTNTLKAWPDLSGDSQDGYLRWYNGTLKTFQDIVSNTQYFGPDGQNSAPFQGNMVGTDWYVDRPYGHVSNYGWNKDLHYDEYPLQIQCSSCFLKKLQYGLSSRHGQVYDEVMSQAWSNIQKNCQLSTTLTPANNLTGVGYGLDALWTYSVAVNRNGSAACTQYITASDPANSASLVAIQNSVSLSSILALNAMTNDHVGSLPICAPAKCKIVVNNERQTAETFLESQENVTLPQLLAWNPNIERFHIAEGEAICVGPPGGLFTPTVIVAASATVYSTTATPALPTVSGTIKYCGRYSNITSSDYCNLISLRYGISLAQFLGMNAALDSDCTNLQAGFAYCVNPCCGSATPVLTTSRTATSKTRSTATSTYVVPPGPTHSGASPNCYQWYLTKSGDYCYAVEQSYGITQAQFNAWNPEVNSNCDIQAGVAYCVNGP